MDPTSKMSTNFELPVKGSDIKVLITRVHLHPQSSLVEFWGKFNNERAEDYQNLYKAIQSPGKYLYMGEGNAGDQCLAQIDGTWYRCRIVSRSGGKYNIFFIDNGLTYSTTNHVLSWGRNDFFNLPPEVECCVLANVLPLSPDDKWSPVALEFVKSLQGQHVEAHVQEVFLSHRTWLLHIPCISKQMYEMGFAKKLSANMFQQFVLIALRSPAEVESSSQEIPHLENERLHKQELYMHPEIVAATVETVVVTEVRSPHRIFCQLKVFSQELKNITDQMAQFYGGRGANCIVNPDMIGYPCAAKTSDGKWHRSVLQQVFPTENIVEVLDVDYGTKALVQIENIRPLSPQFFRMPVVTYICSLHGIIDKGEGWTTSQLDYLKNLILHKTLIAKFEYQSISEGVYYVTLYGDENLNNLFNTRRSMSLEYENANGDFARDTGPSQPGLSISNGDAFGKGNKSLTWPVEELRVNSTHLALVQHVTSPSEFWIKTVSCSNDLDQLMDSLNTLYSDSMNEGVVKSPFVGLFCAAKGDTGDFSRATILKVLDSKVEVFFVDYGNSSEVSKSDIKVLPDQFKKLPWLALKCSLAGLRPKLLKWSHDAVDVFIKQVIGKVFKLDVRSKRGDTYLVKLMDPQAHRKEDIGELLCNSALAENEDAQIKATTTIQLATDAPLQGSSQRCDRWISSPPQANGKVDISEQSSVSFKSEMLPIGSTLEVNVTCIKSPNEFWCQLGNIVYLKSLMHNMQDCYTGSEFAPIREKACVARHPERGTWYRALIVKKHKGPSVDVLFVDYGQMEEVSIYDLRAIRPDFLELNRQAFQCSLLNAVDPSSVVDNWSEEAEERFHSFVESAGSNLIPIKCTIYAIKQKEGGVINVVDLETPFESLSASLGDLVKDAQLKPSIQHDTYFYSTHNIKTGTEERVTVTCIKSVGQFYCQFDRNTEVMEDLKLKVNTLCNQLRVAWQPAAIGTICFAKYVDGQWYRGQIAATNPSLVVHFVDYGDTIRMDKSDLLPVPKEAKNITMIPVQAVLCGLSDVPMDIPEEANKWFETSATDCKFTAKVVAREPDGKLLVELYHKAVQINSKIKKLFKIGIQIGDIHLNDGRQKASANWVHKTDGVPNHEHMKSTSNIPNRFPQLEKGMNGRHCMETKPQTAPTQLKTERKNCHLVRNSKVELYTPPHKRRCNGKLSSLQNGSRPESSHISSKENTLPEDKKWQMSSSPVGQSEPKPNLDHLSKTERQPKIGDLPSKCIMPGYNDFVFVSHCNSPLSFYLQFVEEEQKIFSLVDILNKSSPKCDITQVKPGDLVQAEFEEDSFWYRAVVRDVDSNNTVRVEFVDFGNTANVTMSKLARLPRALLDLPTYSTHCMLSQAAGMSKENVLDGQVLSSFKDSIDGIGDKGIRCKFVKKSGSIWEVSLEDINLLNVEEPTCSLVDGHVVSPDARHADESQLHMLSRRYLQPDVQEGSHLVVYITNTNEDQSFWCHSSNTNALDTITSSVSKVVESPDCAHSDISSLSNGSPCIALYQEDSQWYRAEVLEKNREELSVFYVDYGNKSKVSVADVRKIPPSLLEIPCQAFMCVLKGFESGCWQSGVIDELLSLTADKELQLTVTKAAEENCQMLCYVILECDGVVMNDSLKTWWKTCTPRTEFPQMDIVSPEAQLCDSEADTAVAIVDEPLSEILATLKSEPLEVDLKQNDEDVHISTSSENLRQRHIDCRELKVLEVQHFEEKMENDLLQLDTNEDEVVPTSERLEPHSNRMIMETPLLTVVREEVLETLPSGSQINNAELPYGSLVLREGPEEDSVELNDLKIEDESAEYTAAEYLSASTGMMFDDSESATKSPCEETSTSMSNISDFMIASEMHIKNDKTTVKLIPRESSVSSTTSYPLDRDDQNVLEVNLVKSESLEPSSVFPLEPLTECDGAQTEMKVEKDDLHQEDTPDNSVIEKTILAEPIIEDVNLERHKEKQSELQVEADVLLDNIPLVSLSDKNDSVGEEEPLTGHKEERSELASKDEDLSPEEVITPVSSNKDHSATEELVVCHQNEGSEFQDGAKYSDQVEQNCDSDEKDSVMKDNMSQEDVEYSDVQSVQDLLLSVEIPQDLNTSNLITEDDVFICNKADDSGIPTDDVPQDFASDEEESVMEDLISFHHEDEHLDDPCQTQTDSDTPCTSTKNLTAAQEQPSKLEDERSGSCDVDVNANKIDELVDLFDDINLADAGKDPGVGDGLTLAHTDCVSQQLKMGKWQEDANDGVFEEASSFADEGVDCELQERSDLPLMADEEALLEQ